MKGGGTDWLVFFPTSNHGISLGVQTLITDMEPCAKGPPGVLITGSNWSAVQTVQIPWNTGQPPEVIWACLHNPIS